MPTVAVLAIVFLLGGVGGYVNWLMVTSGYTDENGARKKTAVRTVVRVDNHQTPVYTGVHAPSLRANVIIGVAAGFLLYGFSEGVSSLLVIGGITHLTLSIGQMCLALLGGIAGSVLIKSLIQAKTSTDALKAIKANQEGASNPAGRPTVTIS
jgi:hypothetical protein